MKPHQLNALADGAYALLGAAETAERDPGKYDEAALRELLEPLMRAALPLYTTEALERLHSEAAIEHHGGPSLAAKALGISRVTLHRRRARSAA